MSFDKTIAGKYTVTADALNMRLGAGKGNTVLKVLKKGLVVQNYGYYTSVSGTNWLLVKFDSDVGYCSVRYLVRK